MIVKAGAYEELAAFDVVGREKRVRGATRNLDNVSFRVRLRVRRGVAAADTAHVTDVVAQERNGEVCPVTRRHGALGQQLAAEDLLPHERHHHGVLGIVIEGVGTVDGFYGEVGSGADDVAVFVLSPAKIAVGRPIGLGNPVDERRVQRLDRIEDHSGRTCARRRDSAHYTTEYWPLARRVNLIRALRSNLVTQSRSVEFQTSLIDTVSATYPPCAAHWRPACTRSAP